MTWAGQWCFRNINWSIYKIFGEHPASLHRVFSFLTGLNCIKKLNPTAASFSIICHSFKKKKKQTTNCCFHKSTVVRQSACSCCRFNMFGIDAPTCVEQKLRQVPLLICWQPRVTASTQCGFSKHMTSMITSMGALNRFKFCTCVARQQHNRSPSSLSPPYMALYWDCCASITENG